MRKARFHKEKGRLVKVDSHRRDRRGREEFREYLTVLCQTKPRYVKEQMGLVVRACEAYGRERVMAAMKYCREMELYSAVDLNDAAGVMGVREASAIPERLPVEDERYHVNVQKRALSVYADVACGDSLQGTLREDWVIQ